MSIRYDRPVCPSARYLAENVKRLRMARGWTQSQFGEKIGPTWPQTRISEMESGRFNRNLKALDQVARALRVPAHKLIGPMEGGGGGGRDVGGGE
jgi:transcriptional regulator with XRE-family HTH domain